MGVGELNERKWSARARLATASVVVVPLVAAGSLTTVNAASAAAATAAQRTVRTGTAKSTEAGEERAAESGLPTPPTPAPASVS